MANNVDPGAVCSGSTLFASILNLSVMLGNYMQQTTSADDIFRCIFLGALRVKLKNFYTEKSGDPNQEESELISTPSFKAFMSNILIGVFNSTFMILIVKKFDFIA